MKKLWLCCGLVPFVCMSVFAAGESLNLVRNGGFEQGGEHWRANAGTHAVFGPGTGRNMSRGIRIPVKGSQRAIVSQSIEGIEQNQKYLITAWIKSDKDIHSWLSMDVYKKTGEFCSGRGFYNCPVILGKDWTCVKMSYVNKGEKPEDHNYYFIMVVNVSPSAKNAEGCGYFDDIMFVKDIPSWTLTQIHPTHNSMPSEGGEMILSHYCEQGVVPANRTPRLTAELTRPGAKTVIPLNVRVLPGRLHVKIPPAGPGPATLKVILSDAADGKVYGEKLVPFLIREKQAAPKSACMIDGKGRAIVDGKPFMPLGFYCNIKEDGLSPAFLSMLDRIRDSGTFNCFTAYNISYFLKSDRELTRFFDEAQKRGLKVLPNFTSFVHGGPMGDDRQASSDRAEREKRISRITGLLKNHPAMLAYYIDDETPVGELGDVIFGRRLLNQYDPFHPTWGVSYTSEVYQFYLPAVDVFAYDSYPINRGMGTTSFTHTFARKAHSLTDLVWMAPQCYQADDIVLNVENMTSVCAVGIIYGAKGFIFYSLTTPYDKSDIGRRWSDILGVGKILKELEPFIMSEQPLQMLQVKNFRDETSAALLTDARGNYRIIAAGGSRDHRSEIRIPADLHLVSTRFGHLKETAPGVLLYEGGVLTCDIGVLSRKTK